MKRRPSLVSASNHGLTKNFSSAAKTFIAIQDAGRRTFICFALSSGIPPQVVMKWTGHSDYQAMKPYIAIAEKTKADAMKLFDEELKK